MNLHIIRYCAEEVERQGRGPIQVANMAEAWNDAMEIADVDFIIRRKGTAAIETDWEQVIMRWGHLVEPTKNYGTWRDCSVRVGPRLCPAPSEVGALMTALIRQFRILTPEEVYRRFEEIHPLVDGNGRVGKILLNCLKGTLDKPIMPPNFFNCANP